MIRQVWQAPFPKAVSQGEFDYLIVQLEQSLLNFDGKAPFDRLANVNFDLLHGVSLGGAARYRRDLGPEPSLLGFVDNHTDSHKLIFSLIQITSLGLGPVSAIKSDMSRSVGKIGTQCLPVPIDLAQTSDFATTSSRDATAASLDSLAGFEIVHSRLKRDTGAAENWRASEDVPIFDDDADWLHGGCPCVVARGDALFSG